MIRRHCQAEPMIYYSDEIGRSPMSDFYDSIDRVVGDWDLLAAPLARIFSTSSGRPTDHVLYLKLFLIAYFQNVVYDTRLVAQCADSIAIRRFLCLSLVDRVPDHSSVSRVRDAFAENGGLGEILTQVVEFCEQAGLIEGSSVHVDATLVKANASVKEMRSMDTAKSVNEHLKEAREQGKKLAVKNSEFYSPSDPEARVRKKGSDKPMLCYTGVHVTDSKHQVILAARVDYGDSPEVAASLPAVIKAQQTLTELGVPMDVVVADKGYDSVEFHNRVEELGLRPATFYKRDKKKEGKFTHSDFEFDAERNLFICPWGNELGFRGMRDESLAYVSKVSDCSNCPVSHRCLGEKTERKSLSRAVGEEASDRNRAFVSKREGKSHLRKRSSTSEPPFGHAKRYGGLERVSCKGLAKAEVKFVMGAVAWNILKLVKAEPADVCASPPPPRPRLVERNRPPETHKPAQEPLQRALMVVETLQTAVEAATNAFKTRFLGRFTISQWTLQN
jgi:transposase